MAWLVIFAPIAHATVSTVTIFSQSNNRNISFQIYTPPNYSTSSQRYPTVYSLHGIGSSFQNRSNQVVPTLDAAIQNGSVQPMIYVFPDGQNNAFYGDAFDGHKQVYSNIINEVLPYVDSHYRTLADRGHRAMEGFSMGGFGALMYSAKRPELFGTVVEYGGALSRWQDLVNFNNATAQEMYNGVEANFTPYSLWEQTRQNAATVRGQVNYMMLVGSADGQMNSNTRFRDYLISLGITPQFQILPGIAHDGGAYYREEIGLNFLDDHFIYATGDFIKDDHFMLVPEPACLVGLLLTALATWRQPRK